MHKERFSDHTKLQPRGDGPYKILKRINENAYKFDVR
jgi:hypothetical protein